MTPVTQTKVMIYNSEGKTVQNGNCYAAAIATIMDLPITEVPNVEVLFDVNDDMWDSVMNEWLKAKGRKMRYGAFEYAIFHPEIAEQFKAQGWIDDEYLRGIDPERLINDYYFLSGKSPRGVMHITIWKAGKMVWDPHPSRDGISLSDAVIKIIEVLENI